MIDNRVCDQTLPTLVNAYRKLEVPGQDSSGMVNAPDMD